MKMAETSEVINAADDPSPVLCTLLRVVCVEANSGIWRSELVLSGKLRFSSYVVLSSEKVISNPVTPMVNHSDRVTNLLALRVKVVVSCNDNLEASVQSLGNVLHWDQMTEHGQRIGQSELDKGVLGFILGATVSRNNFDDSVSAHCSLFPWYSYQMVCHALCVPWSELDILVLDVDQVVPGRVLELR